MLGYTPQPYLPILKTRERAWGQQQSHQWFNIQEMLMCVKQGPGAKPHHVWQAAGTRQGSRLCFQGQGVVTSRK